MKTIQAVSRQVIVVTVSLLVGIGLLVGPAFANDEVKAAKVKVDCGGDDDNDDDDGDDDETSADALRKASVGKPLVIKVEGTCTENLTITRDDVTLRGDDGAVFGPDPNASTILVLADRVEIDGLTGIDNFSTLAGNIISNNGSSGIAVSTGGAASIGGNMIDGNGGFGALGLTIPPHSPSLKKEGP